MIFKLLRLIRSGQLLARLRLKHFALGFLAVFFISWFLMYLAEPAGSELVRADTYWWYFIVTISTVGYGDFSPTSLGGKITATVIIFIGIGVFAALAGKILDTVIEYSQKLKKGLMTLKKENHILILGGTESSIGNLINEIVADNNGDEIIFVTNHVEKNEFGATFGFAKGNPTDPEARKQGCIKDASRIIVLGDSDAETIEILVDCKDEVRSDAHIVVLLNNQKKVKKVKKINDSIEVVTSLSLPLLVQAVQDPGATELFTALASNKDTDASSFRINIPEDAGSKTYTALHAALLSSYGVNVVGVGTCHSHNTNIDIHPDDLGMEVSGGMSLVCIGSQRVKESDISWDEVMS
ncbi:MAG: ion channel [Candidatus Pacebacteria bacterium]|nr:ion channel [Candidatus Paceibacterota bacterium]